MSAVDDIATIAAEVPWPDHEAEQAARRRASDLGQLDTLAEWLAGTQGGCPPHDPLRVRALVFAADHGIAAAAVSAYEPSATAQWVADIADGAGRVNVLAELADATVRVVDVGVGKPGGRVDREDALSADDTARAVQAGIDVADDEVDAGTDLVVIGDVGVGATTVAAVLAAVITGTEPVKVIGRGGGIDDDTWMRKATAVRDARLRAWPHRAAPMELLAVAGGADIAAMVGFLVRAASRRTAVLLDGVVAAATALVAQDLQPRCVRWWRAAQRTSEPAHAVALRHLGLEPILDLGVEAGDGTGGLLAVPVLRAAARTANVDGDRMDATTTR
jgi:nicotinate-nucleotide--dimethylbenzimidazole phosphoribosyltransferase